MNNYETFNQNGFEEAAEAKWYSYTPRKSRICDVSFNDGTKLKYACDASSKPDDLFVVAPGCLSSGALGTIAANDGTTKGVTHYISSLISFSKDPTKKDIKSCFMNIEQITDLRSLCSAVDMQYHLGTFSVTDNMIRSVISALSVIAFKEMAKSEDVKMAVEYVSEPKLMPEILLMRKSLEALTRCPYNLPNYSEFILTGYYPNWQNTVRPLEFWNNELFSENKTFSFSKLHDVNGALSFTIDLNKKLKDLFKTDKGFAAAFSELIYRSAVTILIRGGCLNLLNAVFETNMPIDAYYDDLTEFAKAIGSMPCYEALIQRRK